jgi:hypothetical protein
MIRSASPTPTRSNGGNHTVSIPKRSEWKTLKAKHQVADGAVSGINVGDALDKYWNSGATTAKEQLASLEALEIKLNNYMTKLDKKKVKLDYPGFEKEFLNKYLGEAHKLKEDAKRYNANVDLYKKELIKFFTAVQALDKKKTTKAELEKFKSGPVRGLSALGKNVRGADLTHIDSWLGTINDAIQKLPKDTTQKDIETFIDATLKTAEEIKKLAQAQHLA